MLDKVLVKNIEKEDFDYLVSILDSWWGGPGGLKAHPMFLYEFGDFSLISKINEKMIGFLLGFLFNKKGYIHFVGIDPNYRRKGIGKLLYQHFIDLCKTKRARYIKALAAVGNESSISFHSSLGFLHKHEPDYAGPGRSRIVFTKTL